ncbi:MAG: transcription antitermination factor NusB [Clostridia bacterium]|nr:transcription antitermination factor NusB [Clostridia bacterium]
MTRHESREQAFVLVFENIFHPELSVEEIITAAGETDVQCPDDFAAALAGTVIAHKDEADAVIGQFARGWKLHRLSKVALAALRLAICEILYADGVPDGVAINEAVELAKKYATAADASYINGILGSFVRSREKTDGTEI